MVAGTSTGDLLFPLLTDHVVRKVLVLEIVPTLDPLAKQRIVGHFRDFTNPYPTDADGNVTEEGQDQLMRDVGIMQMQTTLECADEATTEWLEGARVRGLLGGPSGV